MPNLPSDRLLGCGLLSLRAELLYFLCRHAGLAREGRGTHKAASATCLLRRSQTPFLPFRDVRSALHVPSGQRGLGLDMRHGDKDRCGWHERRTLTWVEAVARPPCDVFALDAPDHYPTLRSHNKRHSSDLHSALAHGVQRLPDHAGAPRSLPKTLCCLVLAVAAEPKAAVPAQPTLPLVSCAASQVPVYFIWVQKCSYLTYAYSAMLELELSSITLRLPNGDVVPGMEVRRACATHQRVGNCDRRKCSG
jgi:hypothetical protein